MKPLFETSLLQSGLLQWEAEKLATLNRDRAAQSRVFASMVRKAPPFERVGGPAHVHRIKLAIRHERAARQADERAQFWRSLAQKLSE